jgi:hypothetical protein
LERASSSVTGVPILGRPATASRCPTPAWAIRRSMSVSVKSGECRIRGRATSTVSSTRSRIKSCGAVVSFGQALGEGDADRHFHIQGQAAQNFAHQFALALIQTGALDAIERSDGEIDFLAAGAGFGIHGELGQASHIAHILCCKRHVVIPMHSAWAVSRPCCVIIYQGFR